MDDAATCKCTRSADKEVSAKVSKVTLRDQHETQHRANEQLYVKPPRVPDGRGHRASLEEPHDLLVAQRVLEARAARDRVHLSDTGERRVG